MNEMQYNEMEEASAQAQVMAQNVTKQQLLAWLGSDVTKDALVDMLLEIANGEYAALVLKADIAFYEGQGE